MADHSPSPTTSVLLDCDPGIDDAVALAYAVTHPAIDLVGVTTVWGNVDLDQTTRNALHVLDSFGAGHVPVAAGARGPLDGGAALESGRIHGRDGLGGRAPVEVSRRPVDASAAEHLVARCREQPGELAVVAVGPLTNLALALELEPDLPELVRDVTVMGGAALVPGNVTPAAEANIFFDPTAARRVFAAPWSLTVVPLDATLQVRMTDRHRDRLAAGDAAGNGLVAGALDHYLDFSEEVTGERSCAVHDVLAVGVAAGLVEVGLGPTVAADVEDGDGPARGATVFDLRGLHRGLPTADDDAHVRVVLETAPVGFADEVVDTLLASR